MAHRRPIAYLAGGIDAVLDRGRGWRTEFAAGLAELGISAIIPNDLEERRITPEYIASLKARSALGPFRRIFRTKVMMPDMKALRSADMVVVRWDGEPIAGTAHECGDAFLRGQPVFLVTPRAFVEVPNWLLASSTKAFHTFEELAACLVRWKRTR